MSGENPNPSEPSVRNGSFSAIRVVDEPRNVPEVRCAQESFPEIDGGTLIETEQVLVRFAPERLRYTSTIRAEGRIENNARFLPAGFNRYRVCLPTEARQEILQSLRIASRRYEFGTIPHLFRLVALWEKIAER